MNDMTKRPAISDEMVSAALDVLRESGRFHNQAEGADQVLMRQILWAALQVAAGQEQAP